MTRSIAALPAAAPSADIRERNLLIRVGREGGDTAGRRDDRGPSQQAAGSGVDAACGAVEARRQTRAAGMKCWRRRRARRRSHRGAGASTGWKLEGLGVV